ncbi:MAG: helicase [Thermoleophilia bacterium]|nr:helicase [Thermoleophilia bacterium]
MALGSDGEVLLWSRDEDDPAPASFVAARLGREVPEARMRSMQAVVPVDDGDGPELGSLDVTALELGTTTLLDLAAAGGLPGGVGELVRQAAAIVVRQEFVPAMQRPRPGTSDQFEARWRPAARGAARDAMDAIAHALPEAATALRDEHDDGAHPVIVRAQRLVARVVDHLARTRLTSHPVELAAGRDGTVHDRWLRALVGADATVDGPEDALDRLAADVDAWSERLRRTSDSPFRLCLRLEEPDDPTEDAEFEADEDEDAPTSTWRLRYLVQARADPSVIVDLAEAWHPTGATKRTLAALDFHQGQHLFAPLGEAAQHFEPIAHSLAQAHPAGCELDTAQAHDFLADVAPLLETLGIGVFVPAWWRARGGRWQLGVRAQVTTQLTGGRQGMDALNLATLVDYDWRLAVGDSQLTQGELDTLARQRSPLVRVRGKWVELDPDELRAALSHMDRVRRDPRAPSRLGGGSATVGQLLGMSVGAGSGVDGLPVHGVDVGPHTDIADLLTGLERHRTPLDDLAPPAGLRAELRPYQQRGYAWLTYMAQVGLGACLADDMGLGKSVQALAAIQHAWEVAPAGERRPSLIVCPTTVLTNWLRECERFTPDLPVVVHHGAGRASGAELAATVAPAAIVLTSYALLARDAEALREVDWHAVVLDEAQNVKNPGTRHAKAARSLRAPARMALTGTPIENHAGDLWAIMEFLNPGLLGTQVDFRRKYLIPIQTGTFPEAAERLRTVTGPFVMRRLKTDPTVISDLPEKLESTEFCQLSVEQVALYEAIVRDAAEVLRMSPAQAGRSGIERRGLILATISRLKQACNHPAQLLGDNSRVGGGRSGKLQRLETLLEGVLERGERTLVFTQFVQMAELLQRGLVESFGREVGLLTGGMTRTQRDDVVQRFQSADADAPPILVLSLKAGGSGLNLTAATHVVHFDRWWNPATEQQATDRAFRIGQTRDVQVHALVCAGTVEERIDRMLRQKRAVADTVVGGGEAWITELGDDELLDLLALRRDSMLQPGELDSLEGWRWERATL